MHPEADPRMRTAPDLPVNSDPSSPSSSAASLRNSDAVPQDESGNALRVSGIKDFRGNVEDIATGNGTIYRYDGDHVERQINIHLREAFGTKRRPSFPWALTADTIDWLQPSNTVLNC